MIHYTKCMKKCNGINLNEFSDLEVLHQLTHRLLCIRMLDQTPLRMFRIQHKLDVMRIDATSLGVVTLDSDHTSIALGIVCHRAIPAIRQLDSHTLLDIISLHISKDPH